MLRALERTAPPAPSARGYPAFAKAGSSLIKQSISTEQSLAFSSADISPAQPGAMHASGKMAPLLSRELTT